MDKQSKRAHPFDSRPMTGPVSAVNVNSSYVVDTKH